MTPRPPLWARDDGTLPFSFGLLPLPYGCVDMMLDAWTDLYLREKEVVADLVCLPNSHDVDLVDAAWDEVAGRTRRRSRPL